MWEGPCRAGFLRWQWSSVLICPSFSGVVLNMNQKLFRTEPHRASVKAPDNRPSDLSQTVVETFKLAVLLLRQLEVLGWLFGAEWAHFQTK